MGANFEGKCREVLMLEFVGFWKTEYHPHVELEQYPTSGNGRLTMDYLE
jgi:hypothetical protein